MSVLNKNIYASKIAHVEPNNPTALGVRTEPTMCRLFLLHGLRVTLHSARFCDAEMAVTSRVVMCCLRLQGFGGKPLVRPRRRFEIDVKTDLKEIDWEGAVDWIDLAHCRDRWRALVNAIMNIRGP